MIHVKLFSIHTYFLFTYPSHPEWCVKLSYQYYFYFSLYCSNFYFTKRWGFLFCFFFFFLVILCFPCSSAGKESACNAGDLSLIPELGRSLGELKGYPLQFSGLENSMDHVVHGVSKNQTWLNDFHFTFGNQVHSLYFIVFQIVTFYHMFLFVLFDVFGLNLT